MLHDLIIVGAGPVGATLALALFDSDLDVVALDARPAGIIARSDRSLALSHGTRLVFERLGVWSGVTATAGADGRGEGVGHIGRRRHDYGQAALVARIWSIEPHGGLAFERFTDEGPMALLPEEDHYGLVWTTTPENAGALVALPEQAFLAALAKRFGPCAGPWTRV